jgi:hypothetical protein
MDEKRLPTPRPVRYDEWTMHLTRMLAAAVAGLTLGGPAVRAEQPPATPPAAPASATSPTLASRNITSLFATASTAPPLTPQAVRLAFAGEAASAAAALAQVRDAVTKRQDWNCGMPVIQPPADVDPAFEKKPDDTLTITIRRAAPRACGR